MKKKSIEWCQELAKAKRGRCNDTVYIGSKTLMSWTCVSGHVFFSKANTVQQGFWCRTCAGLDRKTLEDCQALAKLRGGNCLSLEYINARTTLLWQCSQGHVFTSVFGHIKNGSWCSLCADVKNGVNRRKRDGFEALRTAVRVRGGVVLSESYKGISARYTYKCQKEHVWNAAGNLILKGHWCRRCCKYNKAQTEVYDFVKILYPDAQMNVKGIIPSSRLELDVYVPSLKKAIELDGEYWHSDPENIERDRRKDLECQELGIKLLRLPYKKFWHKPIHRIKGEQKIREFLYDPGPAVEHILSSANL